MCVGASHLPPDRHEEQDAALVAYFHWPTSQNNNPPFFFFPNLVSVLVFAAVVVEVVVYLCVCMVRSSLRTFSVCVRQRHIKSVGVWFPRWGADRQSRRLEGKVGTESVSTPDVFSLCMCSLGL